MISTIIIFVLTFTVLGLLLGISASYDQEDQVERDPQVQGVLFEKCIAEANSDEEVTEQEYFRCAYSIYD